MSFNAAAAAAAAAVNYLQALIAVSHVQHLLAQAINFRAQAGDLIHICHASHLLQLP